MNLFTPPPSKYDDHFEQGKFNFTWRIYILLGIVFTGLTILHATQNDINMYVTSVALLITIVALFVQFFTKSYVGSTIIGIMAGSLVNQYDLYVIISSQKFITILWIICLTLYAFYLLSTRWGILFLVANLIGVTIAVLYIPKEVLIERIEARSDYAIISIVLNLIIIVGFITYLMNQILKTSRQAEISSKEAQRKLKNQYNIVQEQNEEKTVMLKEIHHRVKNNLQVITSLLRLQSQEIKDEKVLEHFDDAVQRVLAMSLIHERMYQSDDLSKIDLEAYLRNLAEELIASYSVEKPIELKVNCEIDYIQPKSLVSFALIFNELISNTLKHAFTDLEKGEISIAILHPEEKKVEAIYKDSGVWKSPQKEGSFGVQLISDLCEQLDGEFTLDTEKGTTYHFTFEYQNLE